METFATHSHTTILKEIAVATSAAEEQTVGTETAEAETVAIRYIFQSFAGMIMRMVYENREAVAYRDSIPLWLSWFKL